MDNGSDVNTEYKLPNFIEKLSKNLQKSEKVIAFPETHDPRVQRALVYLLANNIYSKAISWIHPESFEPNILSQKNLENFINRIRTPDQFPQLFEQTQLTQVRKAREKGRTLSVEEQKSLGSSPLFQAGTLLDQGETDSVVAGSVATTGEVIKATLKTVGIKKGQKLLSGSFLMHREESQETFLFADCGVIVDPDSMQLASIASSSLNTWNTLFPSTEPIVAFLSFSTIGSATHIKAKKMSDAASIFRQMHPDVVCEGEIQFDAAYDKSIGQKKIPGSQLPGKANIFIFPDLDSGNIAYKITQRLGHFDAYGPLLQGSKKPYTDLSRGASWEDIVSISIISGLL